jgi:hypothetical protein
LILAYLSRRRTGSTARDYVEPFQLQLVCQRIEELVTLRQAKNEQELKIGFDDLGGEPGLKETLRDFYKQVIKAIKPVRTRWRVRRLCEQHLISAEGRRLSLERGEIMRKLNLSLRTLDKLVESRLVRSDPRGDSWYYELTHDSLIGPVLATRRPQAIAIGALGIVASVLGCISGVLLLAVAFSPLLLAKLVGEGFPLVRLLVIAIGVMLPIAVLLLWSNTVRLRQSYEMLSLYMRRLD